MEKHHIYDKDGNVKMLKSKDEQKKELEYLAQWYAEKKCKLCYGRGWIRYVEEVNMVQPCACLLMNIDQEAKEKNVDLVMVEPKQDFIKENDRLNKVHKENQFNSHIYSNNIG